MSDWERLVSVSLPFALAALVQLSGCRVRAFAQRAVGLMGRPPEARVTETVQQRCVNLAVHVYLHLTFVVATLMACAWCASLSALCSRAVLPAAAGVAGLAMLLLWVFWWQFLTPDQMLGPAGRLMRVCAWVTLALMWALSTYVCVSSPPAR